MAAQQFDLIVLGGGPGGYVGAIRGAQLGLKTAVVEREHMGGICLNWGCIPTKALLRSSEIHHLLHRLDEFGFSAKDIKFDVQKSVSRSRKIADQLSKGVGFLMKKHKITVFDGHGKLNGPGKMIVEKDGKAIADLTAKHIILASGARARDLPDIKADGKIIWSYKEAMVPKTMPKSILVIGSGAIGIEFASFYQAFDVDVTVVEVLDRILPAEDEEISAFALKSFKKQGMKFMLGANITDLKTTASGATAKIEVKGKTETLKVDRVILSVGIIGNVEDIGLDTVKGVTVDRSHVVVNKWLETGAPGIYAIGDLVGPPWLAHKAMHEGVICVEKIVGGKSVHAMDNSKIPGCTYCTPQIASVGLTEAAAKEAGFDVKIGRFPFMGNGKAIALGEMEGMIKTVFDAKSGELLGAHMIGAEVTELIQGYAIAQTLETTEADLMRTVFPHPTLSEMMHESVLDAYDQALHI